MKQGKYKRIIVDGKEYLNMRYDLFRLEMLEKLSSITALLLFVIVALVLGVSVWAYISCILVIVIDRILDGFIPALAIMGGFNLLMLFVVFLLKDQLIVNPLIRRFSKIIFDRFGEDAEELEEDEKESEI
jgi:hypothetical protein